MHKLARGTFILLYSIDVTKILTNSSQTSPMDTMKTKYQRNCLMHHRDRTEKVPMDYMSKAAWRGMPINLMRSGMTNLVFFVVFERTKKYINAMQV
jgi:hypothetical protein